MNLYYIFIAYNFVVFLIFGTDKLCAVKKHRRISEKALLLFSFFLGATGGMLGMIVFCHKTRKPKFRALMPLFYILNFALLYMAKKYGIISV